MKKSIIISAAVAVGLSAAAVDVMTITFNDNTTRNVLVSEVAEGRFTEGNINLLGATDKKADFGLADIASVKIDDITAAFTVTPTDVLSDVYSAIPTVLRMDPVNSGDATGFGFGTVEATCGADIVAGQWGVWFTLSPLKVYTGEIDLADAANLNSYSFKLMKYDDGQAIEVHEGIKEGTLNTSRDAKGNVTIEYNVTFTDGTSSSASYKGKVTAVETLDDIIPAKRYGNEVYYYNSSGEQLQHQEIVKMTVSRSSWSGKNTITLYLPDDAEPEKVTFVVKDALINCDQFNLAEAADGTWSITYGSFQMQAPGNDYAITADNGVARVTKNDDGTYEIFFDAIFSGTSYMGSQGDKSRLVFNYVGAAN